MSKSGRRCPKIAVKTTCVLRLATVVEEIDRQWKQWAALMNTLIVGKHQEGSETCEAHAGERLCRSIDVLFQWPRLAALPPSDADPNLTTTATGRAASPAPHQSAAAASTTTTTTTTTIAVDADGDADAAAAATAAAASAVSAVATTDADVLTPPPAGPCSAPLTTNNNKRRRVSRDSR